MQPYRATALILWSALKKKSGSVPFHLSRAYLRMKDAPRPFFLFFFVFFFPKDTWAHAAWPAAWTKRRRRRRRRSRMHSSGAWRHHGPIPCSVTQQQSLTCGIRTCSTTGVTGGLWRESFHDSEVLIFRFLIWSGDSTKTDVTPLVDIWSLAAE